MALASRFSVIGVLPLAGLLIVVGLVCYTSAPFDARRLVPAGEARDRRLDTNASTPAEERAYPDVQKPGCSLGSGCSGLKADVHAGRYICVKAGFTEECWDVCNIQHTPQAYQVGDKSPLNSALAGMVAQVRQGLNSYVQCPGSLAQGDMCVPGKVCGQRMSKSFDVPVGQGMCVVDSTQPNSRACWDMCDYTHKTADYTTGTAAGVGDSVEAVRNNHTCPSSNWWLPWLLALVAMVVILCCVAVVMAVVFSKKKSRGSASRLEAQPEFNNNLNEAPFGEQMHEDYGRDGAEYGREPQDYGQDAQEYHQEYRSEPRDLRMAEPPPQAYAGDSMQQDMLPPEPPRMEQMQMQHAQMRQESPQQMPDRRSHDLLGAVSHSSSHRQEPRQIDYSKSEYASGMSGFAGAGQPGFAGAGSMRIPGLNEPQLLPSVQPLLVPQTTAHMAPADLLSQALPMQQQRNMFGNLADPLGMSQSHGALPVARQGMSFPNAFQTQMPTSYTTQPPMSGLSMPSEPVVFQSGAPAAQPFFTQIARR